MKPYLKLMASVHLNMDYGVSVLGGPLSVLQVSWAASKFKATSYYSVHPIILSATHIRTGDLEGGTPQNSARSKSRITSQGAADIRSSFDVPQLAAPEAGKEIAIRYLCRFLPQLIADSEMQHATTTMRMSIFLNPGLKLSAWHSPWPKECLHPPQILRQIQPQTYMIWVSVIFW